MPTAGALLHALLHNLVRWRSAHNLHASANACTACIMCSPPTLPSPSLVLVVRLALNPPDKSQSSVLMLALIAGRF